MPSEDDQILGGVPPGAVEHEPDEIVRSGPDLAGEGGQDLAEHRRIDRIGEEPDHFASGRPDEAEDVEPLEPKLRHEQS